MTDAQTSMENRNPLEPFVLDDHRILVGDLVLDLALRTIHSHRSQGVTLSGNEFIMLHTLAKSPGRFIAKHDLLMAVAGAEIEPHEGIVDTYIKYLHRRLQEAGSAATIEKSIDFGFRLCP